MGASGWERVKIGPTENSTGPSKTKSSEPKCNTVPGTSYSSDWAIRTLGGVVTHEVPLPGAPTVRV
jgi:hypothetical protein